ncbi:sugar phosphate nucleotidyltransferase [Cohnella sp. GCM10027633]|uniref:sugar phosphate nucleotidyltransferase n=1 Tax=unclassified Cohnella TaxID=2636738 RepID=UPI0036326F44
MKIVLLSGGSGKRLWPLSNDSRSKQFLKLLENSEGNLESMVQRIWRQIRAVGLEESAYVATGESQLDIIYSQLGMDVPVIVEPCRRDTFAAIALTATYLYSVVGVGLEEVVAVMPVDPFVDDRFFRTIKSLEDHVRQSGADLALIGVKPTYPSEKYGYIVPVEREESAQANTESYRKVGRFAEKPREDEAQRLIDRGALWNCGVFAFKLDYLIQLLIQMGLPIHYEEAVKQYTRIRKISFDYEVVEKAANVVVTSYDGGWKDLGTWNTLSEEVGASVIGKGLLSEDTENSHIINELDIPIVGVGLRDLVIAASPDGILVSDKASSPRLKEMLGQFDQRPMYEERRWGWYKVLDYGKFESDRQMLIKRIFLHSGKNSSYHFHRKRSEVWTVLSGEGELLLDDKPIRLRAGDVITIPAFARHGIRATTDLELLEVQYGQELTEEDIIRLFTEWNEYAGSLTK